MAAEAQLRAEVLSLRRSNSSLQRRVSQLQSLLGELQPLWLEAPASVQEQVQKALSCSTPRLSKTSEALEADLQTEALRLESGLPPSAPQTPATGRPSFGTYSMATPSPAGGPSPGSNVAVMRERLELATPKAGSTTPKPSLDGTSPSRDPHQQMRDKLNARAERMGNAATPTQPVAPMRDSEIEPLAHHGTPGIPKLGLRALTPQTGAAAGVDVFQTPPGSGRHRLDSDADSEEEDTAPRVAELGEVTVSHDHYKNVLTSLQKETEQREGLEKEVQNLRNRITTPRTDLHRQVDRALAREAATRAAAAQALEALSEEWMWHGLPTGAAAVEAWGTVSGRGGRALAVK